MPKIGFRALGGTALATFAVLVMIAPGRADVSPPPVAGGPPPLNSTVKFFHVNINETGTCWSPAGGSAALNNQIVEYYCDTDPSRLWELLRRDDGLFEIYNESDGLCLSPAGGSTATGAPMVQYYCDTDPARGWTLTQVTDDSYLVQNAHSHLCVSGAPAGLGINLALTQAACDTTTIATQWDYAYGDVLFNIRADNAGLSRCPEPADHSTAINATVVSDGFCPEWKIVADGSGFYDIHTTGGYPLCLSPAGGSTAANAAIVQYYCDGDPARHWRVLGARGTYQFQNVKSGLCLSPAGGSIDNGAVMVQYYCDGDPSRLWTIFEGPYKV